MSAHHTHENATPALGAKERSSRLPMVWEVIREVSQHYGEPVEAILGDSRRRHLCFVRHVAMYLAHDNCGKSLPQLASAFQRSDHTTVMHAVRRIKGAMEKDVETREAIDSISERLQVRMTWGAK